MKHCHVQNVNCLEVVSGLPDVVPFSSVDLSNRACDLLICAAGFEHRSAAIARVNPAFSPNKVIVVDYPTNKVDNLASRETIMSQFSSIATALVTYNRRTFRRDLSVELGGVIGRDGAKVVVDISAMSSYVVYRVLYVLCEYLPAASIGVFYAEAEDYYPTSDEIRNATEPAGEKNLIELAEKIATTRFQSRGIDETYECELFPGTNKHGLPARVVMIPNFSRERTNAMLSYAERNYAAGWSERIIWLLGDPPDRTKNGWRTEAIGNLYGVRKSGVAVCTRNYKEILRVLYDQWEDTCLDEHLILASLGSKMQHLGTFLFLKMRPEVGLVLSQPTDFVASKFSSGTGPLWWVDLGRIDQLMDLLKSCGQLKFEW